MSLQKRLSTGIPIVLDGAMGTLLPAESQAHALWSTHTLVVQPDEIEKIHRDYIANGSEMIQTSSYQTFKSGLEKWFPDQKHSDVLKKSITLADRARAGSKNVFIAGSVGPYGASLANGSEYTGDYGSVTKEDLKAFHEERVNIFCEDDRVDLIAFETMPHKLELETLIEMMNTRAKPYYISLSVKETTLADGTSVEEIKQIISKAGDNLVCVGVNCLNLGLSLEWLKILKPLNRGLIVYPNSGEVYKDRQWVVDESIQHFTWGEYVQQLKEIGDVRIVGGCCRTTPRDIGQMKKAVEDVYKD